MYYHAVTPFGILSLLLFCTRGYINFNELMYFFAHLSRKHKKHITILPKSHKNPLNHFDSAGHRLVGGGGFEPPKSLTTDLQSVVTITFIFKN